MTVVYNLILLICSALNTNIVVDDPPDPSMLKDKVTIEVGKKSIIEFEQKNDALVNPKTVDKSSENPPTPSFEFTKKGDNLMLVTKNPYRKDMTFRALARLKGRKDYFETSIVPVRSGLLSFEVWSDPIEELILFEFKLTDHQ